ncbi:hypothetical protein CDA63_11680 [Hymenobacter amundsenii]|uniref:Phage tail tape measure protein domain-containing protein n=1 Tax=Hymenobacter amundsenii TaxID=2006685 RepID=A0A246FK00_9BACT|nr:phage tail tape measure protein [Hymenobacter amundsenii]OWP62871.1 hypothetical protein CDA63_11680 [Hymenobacter amundsenii]
MAENSEERKVRIVLDAQQPNASIKEMGAGLAVLNSQLGKMAQDDPGRAKLQDDYARLNQRIAETRAEMRAVVKTAEELAAEQQQLAEQTEQLAQAQTATVRSGQLSTASMREMKDAAGILATQLEQVSADDPGRAALLRDYQVLQQRVQAAGTEMRTYQKTAEELAAEQRQLAEATERTNQENRQVVLNGQKVDATFGQMKASASALEKQLDDLAGDDPGRAKLLKDYKALKDRIEDVKKEMGEATETGLTFKDALSFAGVAVGAEAALDMIKEFGAEVINTTTEIGKMRSDINSLTGASGQELDALSTGIRALSQTFGKEYNEVLVASNSLSKQMGISQKEALDLIEKGFISGADANGEFLDQLREYPAQFKAAGVSASEFVAIVSKSQTDGVFSDKGVDVVKEFGLRIREQTKATGESLEAAFGTEFTKKLFAGINDGSISSVEALKLVSTQMNDTQVPAAQLQTVIADVFGGPGEDAGLDYLKSLRNVGGGIDELIDHTNPYIQQQEALLASQKELAGAQNELAKEFEGTGNTMEVLSNGAMTFLYTLLVSLAATWKEAVAPVREMWDELGRVAEQMGLVSKEGSLAKDIANGLGAVIRFLFTPTRLLWGVLSDMAKATLEWGQQSANAKALLVLMIAPLRLLFDMLRDSPAFFEGFSAAAKVSFGQVGKAWKAVMAGDISGAVDEFNRIGGAAGRAYLDAFNATRAARPTEPDAPAPAGGDDAAGNKPGGGGDGTTQAERDKTAKDAQTAREKARKEREADQKAADQLRLDNLKKIVAEELGELSRLDVLRNQLGQQADNDELTRRQQQRDKLFQAASAQVDKLTGLESDYTERVEAIIEERDLSLRELQAKFDEESEKRKQEEIDKRIAVDEAETEQRLAELELKLANGELDEWAYQDAVYAVKQAALERELDLIKQKSGEESAEYKKLTAEKLKDQADFVASRKGQEEGLYRAQKFLTAAKNVLHSDELATLLEVTGKKTLLYKAAMAVQKALSIAEIYMSLPKQFASNAEAGAKIAAIAPPVTIPLGTAYTVGANVAAGAAAGAGVAKILGLGFRKGGDTGSGQADGGLSMAGFTVAANGKLLDAEGYPIAGVVHEKEYVIPEWMRADPKVVQIEQFLEAKRQTRGFREGGATSDDVVPTATAPRPAGEERLVQVLDRLDSRLGNVEQWAKELAVHLDVYGLEQTLDEREATRKAAEIR